MGGPGSGRRVEQEPRTRAGLLLLAWAREQPPGALVRLALELDVSPWTVTRWITGRPEWEPRISQAIAIRRLTRVPLTAWGETVEGGKAP